MENVYIFQETPSAENGTDEQESAPAAMDLAEDDLDIEEIEEIDDVQALEAAPMPAAPPAVQPVPQMDALPDGANAAEAGNEAEDDGDEVMELDADDIDIEMEDAPPESPAEMKSASPESGGAGNAMAAAPAQPPASAVMSSLDDMLNEAIDAAESASDAGASDEAPIVISEALAKDIDACARGLRTLTPASGAKVHEEWLGHVLMGYAPFCVSIRDRGAAGDVDFSPLRSMTKSP